MTAFTHESRVLKEVCAIKKHRLAKLIFIAALHEETLPETHIIETDIELKRFILASRGWSKSFLVQIAKYIEFIYKLFVFYRDKGIGIINIHSLELLPAGVLLKHMLGAKLIYDTHELETEIGGMHGIRKKIAKSVERLFIQQVDELFVVSDSIAEAYASMYRIATPHVILNCPEYSTGEKGDVFNKCFNLSDDVLIFLYQGGLVKGRGVELILESFKKLKQPGLVVVFMGYGPLEEEIQRAAADFPNILYHQAVPPHDLYRYTCSADVGFSMAQNTCLSHYYCLPNKLFEYTMAGLPVVVSNMKEMSRFVTTNNLGVVTKNETVEDVIDAILTITKMDLLSLRQNALKAAKSYNWGEQEKVLVAAYEKLVGTTA